MYRNRDTNDHKKPDNIGTNIVFFSALLICCSDFRTNIRTKWHFRPKICPATRTSLIPWVRRKTYSIVVVVFRSIQMKLKPNQQNWNPALESDRHKIMRFVRFWSKKTCLNYFVDEAKRVFVSFNLLKLNKWAFC